MNCYYTKIRPIPKDAIFGAGDGKAGGGGGAGEGGGAKFKHRVDS